MTNSVTLNGNTYNDGDTPPRNLGNGGHRDNLVPMLADAMIDIAAKHESVSSAALLAAASAATALSAPGTSATSTTSMSIATGAKTFAIQAGKSIAIGASVKIASTAGPTNWMHGDVTAYDSGTGSITVNVTKINGAGAGLTAWTLSLSGPAGADSTNGGKESVFVPASQVIPNTTAGSAALATVELGSNKRMLRALDFDGATAESAQFYVRMPKRWNGGTITASLLWYAPVASAGLTGSSYSNTYGSGDRTGTVTASNSGAWNGAVSNLIDGTTDQEAYPNGWGAAGDYLQWQFPSPQYIDEVHIKAEARSFPWPTCKWQGSNDGAVWVDLSTGLLGSLDTDGETYFSVGYTDGTPYSRYRLTATGGSAAGSYYVYQVNFRIGGTPSDPATAAVKWNVSAVAVGDGGALDVASGAAGTVTDALGAVNTLRVTAETAAITPAGAISSRDALWVTVTRDATNVADTLPADARLLGVEINYTATANSDD